MIEVKFIDGCYHLEISKGTLVLTREQFIDGLRRGKWVKRRASKAPRHATMHDHADAQRSRRLRD